MTSFTGIAFAPLVPWALIGALAGAAAALLAFGAWRRAPGIPWRALALAVGIGALANPSVVQEERRALLDVAVLVIDESPSQSIGNRRQQAADAAAALTRQLSAMPELEVRTVAAAGGDGDQGTRLFDAVRRALADVPAKRTAGVVLLTDGQVHDVPAQLPTLGGPLHVLLTGDPGEKDRRLVVDQAPSFGMVGGEVAVTLTIDDPTAPAGTLAGVKVAPLGGQPSRLMLPVNKPHTLPVRIEHRGLSVIELEVDAGEGELTTRNNRALLEINGVRERLRVLLISGEAHTGERVWRNLLKADPAVDLVHFTILRPPEKQDGTPIRELSLIAFPTRELFELKLDEFDLVIFDRYQRRGILPMPYFENIAAYVDKGGALLEASGPAFASPLSLYRTPLSRVLPGRPTGLTIAEGFRPGLTVAGKRHPVTAELAGANADQPNWGRWLRMVDVEQTGGHAVLDGHGGRPLLLLDRAGKGRVAQLLSDHAWLWARGYEGGGPQAELLRRLAHWLMKEPDLEEERLGAEARGGRLEITRRSLQPSTAPVTVTLPDGTQEVVTLEETRGGRAAKSLPARQVGLYRLDDGKHSALAAVGAGNDKEFADLRATPKLLAPAAEASGGAVRWLAAGDPNLRRVAPGRDLHGRDWLGLVAHKDYTVTGVRQATLLPGVAVLALVLGGLLLAWRREGK
jgi:hypothetical protein